MQTAKKANISIFLPFLGIYFIFFTIFYVDGFRGDEGRYYQLAQNLLEGFYSPSDNVDLPNGPGYPIFLMPFLAFDVPVFYIRLTNIFLHFFSIVFLFLSLNRSVNRKLAYVLSFFWGAYYIAYQEIAQILTEPLTLFLVTLLVYYLGNTHKYQTKKNILICGFLLGYLVLTKVIFGYVLIILFVYSIISYVISRHVHNKSNIFISLIAFLVISPYLMYTHSITDKIFFLSTAGGSSLYWMSNPNEKEYGDWNNYKFTANCVNTSINECNSYFFEKNHGEFFNKISKLSTLDRDNELKRTAIENIVNHPKKYLLNWVDNVSRLFLGVPNSYFLQGNKTFYRFVPNAIIFVILLYSMFISIISWKKLPVNMKYLIILLFSYLFLTSLVSAYPRQLYVIVPIILFWFGCIFNSTIKINRYTN